MTNTFYGKYRATVSDIKDPLMTFRIKARVPDVYGDRESGWAMPCLPFGSGSMGFFALPKVGSGVWIEFEHGDPDRPIWSGCWLGSQKDVPPALLAPAYKKLLIKTEGGNSILLDDTPGKGGITLETAGGQKLTMSAKGIELNDGKGTKIALTPKGIEIDDGKGGKIAMTGPKVSINGGALEVI